MKYFSRISLVVIMLMASILSCVAYDFSAVCSTGQTLYYKITNSDLHYVEITFPGNSGTYWEGYTKPSGRMVLPRSVRYNSIDYSVTRVGSCAFDRCTELTSVTIPNSIVIIADCAFYKCSGLSGLLSIPNSVTGIGQSAFSECSNLTGSLSIPNSVTYIGPNAFGRCSRLSSVTIPNSVTRIDPNPFKGCSGLTSIRVADDNQKYDSRGNCNAIIDTETNSLRSGIKTTVIPNTVTEIGYAAFASITSLTSITIPSSVTNIENLAFHYCSSLASVNIPSSVMRIGQYAFLGTKIYNTTGNWNQEVLYIDGCLIATKEYIPANYTIKPATRVIADFAFYGRSRLTSISIPNSVVSIGLLAFSGCGIRGELNIPNSVTSIGDKAFSSCTGLTSMTIPNSVTSIGEQAFEGCTGLTSVTIPKSVSDIGRSPFSSCAGLTSIVVSSDNPIYDSRDNCNAIIETATNTMINGCKKTVIPNSVAIIGELAFYGCSGLTSVEIPNSVSQINYSAFGGCTSLTTVTVKRITPPNVNSPGFPYQSSTLIVPCNYGYAYHNHYSWKKFSSINDDEFLFDVQTLSNDESIGLVSIIQHPSCENNTAIVKAESIDNHPFKHWTKNGIEVSTDNPYYFVVDDDIELVAHFSGMGLEEEILQLVSVSPNPAQSLVNIECENMKCITLYTMDGRVLRNYNELNTNVFALDMTGLPRDIYVLRIETWDGIVVNRKIVKE